MRGIRQALGVVVVVAVLSVMGCGETKDDLRTPAAVEIIGNYIPVS